MHHDQGSIPPTHCFMCPIMTRIQANIHTRHHLSNTLDGPLKPPPPNLVLDTNTQQRVSFYLNDKPLASLR
jgi:hypothetical protein